VLASAILGTLVLAGSATVAPEPAVLTLADDKLRIRDLARGAGDGEMIVASLPSRAAELTLNEEQRVALLRKRVPGVRFALRHGGDVRFARGPGTVVQSGETACFSARTEIPVGHYVGRDEVNNVPCIANATEPRLRYDAEAAAAVARASIPAGSYLGRLRLPESTPVAAGRSMLLRTRVGPVSIERTVTALQSGRVGERLFVRTDDGKLMASRLSPESTTADKPE